MLLPVLSLRGNYGLDDVKRLSMLGLSSSGLLLAAGSLLSFRRDILKNPQTNPIPFFLVVGLLGLQGAKLGYQFLDSLYSSKVTKFYITQRMFEMVYDWAKVIKVADIGCGQGMLTASVAKHLEKFRPRDKDPNTTYLISCVDSFSSTSDKLAQSPLRKKYLDNLKYDNVDLKHIKLQDSLLTTIFLPDNTYDLVISALAIHELGYSSHESRKMTFKCDLIPRQQQQLALKEMVRICRPGGQILIWDVDYADTYGELLSVHPEISIVFTSQPFYAFGGRACHIVSARKVKQASD